MKVYDAVVRRVCAVDASEAAFVPQMAPDDAAAWRAFGAYALRCFASEPLARARAARQCRRKHRGGRDAALHGATAT